MSTREYRFPDVGEGTAEGELLTWYVTAGDRVEEDQVIAEVETDKAVVDIPAPVDGTVAELRYAEGDVIPVGEVFVVFDVDGGGDGEPASTGTTADAADAADTDDDDASAAVTGDAADAADTADDAPAATDRDATAADTEPSASASEGAASDGSSIPAAATGRTFASPTVRRLARELGVPLDDVTGTGAAGRVTEGDVRAAAGGATRRDEPGPSSGADEAAAATAAGATEAPRSGEPTADTSAASAATAPAGRDRTLAQPTTRRVAHELGVDIDAVPATAERDGEAFVTAEAVQAFAESGAEEAGDPEASPAPDSTPSPSSTDDGVLVEERVPYRGVRRTIGRQMERSKSTIPHVTTVDEVDVTELVEVREELSPAAAERDVTLTYLAFVVKAIGTALQEFPYLNATLDTDAEEIVLKGEYNVGIATEAEDGLRVPVVDDVDRKSLLEVARDANRVTQRARDGSITREEMQGGTFTLSNIGPYGGEHGTPIINYPEVGIIAMGRAKQKPRVVDGEVVPRHVMHLSLSFDHRIVDGAMAAQFLNRVKEQLEAPALFLLD